MRAMVGSGEYKLPPEEVLFPARLKAVEEHRVVPKDTSKKAFTKWRWTFEITGPGGDGSHSGYEGTDVRIDTWPSISMREDDVARQMVETLRGRAVDAGEDINTDDYLGMSCMLLVRHGEPFRGRKGEEIVMAEVDQIYPADDTQSGDTEPPF